MLTTRDQRILEHVAHYRLTTGEVVRKVFDLTADQAKGVLRRLALPHKPGLSKQEAGELARSYYLRARPLVNRRVYYHLTKRATEELGVSNRLSKALGDQVLPELYAVLCHCALNESKHRLLSPAELTDQPRFAGVSFTNARYCAERVNGKTLLSRILLANHNEPADVLSRCRTSIRTLRKHKAFAQMMGQGVFKITVLALQEEQKRAIERANRKPPERLSVPLSVHAVPLLSELLTKVNR
ncbi:MAG: hypothetical protein MI923_25860 [Phycisphaerales bacterium]|nr:hypothetical protein [Phycisphaerales bacterium]